MWLLAVLWLAGCGATPSTSTPKQSEESVPATPPEVEPVARFPDSLAAKDLPPLLVPLRVHELYQEAEYAAQRLARDIRAYQAADRATQAMEEPSEKQLESLQASLKRVEQDLNKLGHIVNSIEVKGGDPTAYRRYRRVIESSMFTGSASEALIPIETWKQRYNSREYWISRARKWLWLLPVWLIAWVSAFTLSRVVRRWLIHSENFSVLFRKFAVRAVRRFVWACAILVSLSVLGIRTGPLLTALGAAGLVLGLALQNALGNLVNGLLLMVYRPFDVGDRVNAAGTEGFVQHVGLVSTTLHSIGHELITVPNSVMWNTVITNRTGLARRWLIQTVAIRHGSNVEQATKVIESVLAEAEWVLESDDVEVGIDHVDEWGIHMTVRCWCRTEEYWDCWYGVYPQVLSRLEAAGIEVAIPQRELVILQKRGDLPGHDPDDADEERPEEDGEGPDGNEEPPAGDAAAS